MRRPAGLIPFAALCAIVLAMSCQQGQEADEETGAPVDTSATTMTEEPDMAAGGGGEAGGDDVAVGKQVYDANCATCHGPGGGGDGPAGAGLQPTPANFTDSEWKYGGDLEAIKNTINNGVPGTAMIGWKGTLTDTEITAVAQHEMAFSGGGAGASAR